MIDLSKASVIGEGNERICYQHPNNKSKVIKITKSDVKSRKQNEIDSIYYKYLQVKGIDFSHLAICYGYEKTNLGNGLVFENISNEDNSKIFTFEDILKNKSLDYNVLKTMLDNLANYLMDNKILFVDVGLSNLICKKDTNGEYKLIIIDGLGSRHLGLKFWLYRNFLFLAKIKIDKQIKKLYASFEKMVK